MVEASTANFKKIFKAMGEAGRYSILPFAQLRVLNFIVH
jgi:hypothetical protein